MPELPEVETIRSILSKQVAGAKIADITVHYTGALNGINVYQLVDGLVGAIILNVERRGKFFQFNLDKGQLVIHLRLNGMLHVSDSEEKPKYPIVDFILTDGRVLHLCDPRKFAKVSFIPIGSDDTISGVHKLGIEPFDKKLTVEYLKNRWKLKSGTVKEALLEQSTIAGFGNIYSDELLFYCGINPMKRCMSLTDRNYEDIVKAIPDIMIHAIAMNNVSEGEYEKIRNHEFGANRQLRVYGRDYEPCMICGTKIESTQIGGRTSRFCPACQHKVKFVDKEVTPDMLATVAKYIGARIEADGKFDPGEVPSNLCFLVDTTSITWEHFVWCAYKYVMTEDAVSVSDQRLGVWRKDKVLAIYNMNDSHFSIGISWLKSQKWRES